MKRSDRPAVRRAKLLRALKREKLDGLLVTNVHNVRYLTGFTGDDGILLVRPEETVLITDSRYAEQAEGEAPSVRLVVRRRGLMLTAGRLARREGIGRLGVEAREMPLASFDDLKANAGPVELRRTAGLVERLRAVKDATEIEAIRRAARIAEEAFEALVPQLRPGMTEMEAARRLDRGMEDRGAAGPAFPTIVAAGERSSLPHAPPTGRRLKRGEAVLFDWGARFGLYHSDLTRVLFLYRIPKLFRRLYPIVLEAQKRALGRLKAGRTAGAVDAAARDYLKSRRHRKHFGHSLGHGVGLEVHEAPSLAPGAETKLKAGMVVTVEPGVYLPGRGGVRIEDLVLVTRRGYESLTSTSKRLEAIPASA
jgi:Xaa-Pro aminopeptidase